MPAELTTRDDLGPFLNALGLTGCGVEVGAYRGEFSRQVLSKWIGIAWFLLDPWEVTPEFLKCNSSLTWDMVEARRSAEQLASEDERARLIRIGDSREEALLPAAVDIAYIDGSHDTRSVLHDLETWWPRVRPGGILAGHDYLDDWRWHDDINKGVLFGVRTAVDWFACRVGRIVAATQEEFPTWWFRKPVGSPSNVSVVSATTPDLPWKELAIRNHKRYCERHGYAYRHETVGSGRVPAAWEKVRLVREALKTADWVLWIDADALFQRPDIRLEDFWDGGSPFIWFKDTFNGLNLGTFFARRCPEADEFLDRWYRMSEHPEWRDHKWWENGAAIELERRGELPGLILPHRLANSYPHLPNEWEPGDFIIHCAGLLRDTRLTLLEDFAVRADLAFDRMTN